MIVGGVSFVVRCLLRVFERFEMIMCMGGGLGVDRCLLRWVVFACVMLEVMSGCLEFSTSCSDVGQGGEKHPKKFVLLLFHDGPYIYRPSIMFLFSWYTSMLPLT